MVAALSALPTVYLSYWLCFVACLRLLSVFLGYLGPGTFREQIFCRAPTEVSPLYARTFAIWTAVTCTLTTACALNLTHERVLYLVTMASFAFAFVHFVSEWLVYRTMGVKQLLSPGIVASVSFVWMAVAYPQIYGQFQVAHLGRLEL